MIQIAYLTGISGAGKTSLAHAFEERGYRIIENVPNEVLAAMLKEIKKHGDSYGKVIIVQDIREAKTGISILKATAGIKTMTIALDCSLPVLLTRYRLSRRVHPLQAQGYLLDDALKDDVRHAQDIRNDVDLFIDTTDLSVDELKESVFSKITSVGDNGMVVSFLSFGYKYGLPSDAEYIFDCRDLSNPYWIASLREYTGLDQPVIDYFKSKRDIGKYVKGLIAFLEPVLEKAQKNGRKFLFIYLGCTGGQHRSVYIANELYKAFKDKYYCMVAHRDIEKRGVTL